MNHRLVRYPELWKQKGIPWSQIHLDRLEKAGQFPKRIHLGVKTVVWVEEEIDAFLASKFAAREKVDA